MKRDPSSSVEHYFPVKVQFPEYTLQFDSLLHLYSDYYQQYLRAEYSRLFVRFEDMLIDAPGVLSQIAECTGIPFDPIQKMMWKTQSSKKHGSGTTFLEAIWKTADRIDRIKSLTPEDLQYVHRYMDPELLHLFQYQLPNSLDSERSSTPIPYKPKHKVPRRQPKVVRNQPRPKFPPKNPK
jgi:hypothetical protein